MAFQFNNNNTTTDISSSFLQSTISPNTSPIYVPQCDSPVDTDPQFDNFLDYLTTPEGTLKSMAITQVTDSDFPMDYNFSSILDNASSPESFFNDNDDLSEESEYTPSVIESTSSSQPQQYQKKTTVPKTRSSTKTSAASAVSKVVNSSATSSTQSRRSTTSTISKNDPNRNARLAKENRERKKAEMAALQMNLQKSEAQISSLMEENATLRQAIIEREQRIRYLESCMAAQDGLSSFLRAMQGAGVCFDSSANSANRKRAAPSSDGDDGEVLSSKSRRTIQKSSSKSLDGENLVIPITFNVSFGKPN